VVKTLGLSGTLPWFVRRAFRRNRKREDARASQGPTDSSSYDNDNRKVHGDINREASLLQNDPAISDPTSCVTNNAVKPFSRQTRSVAPPTAKVRGGLSCGA
jgi:hypothetical protein